MREPRIASRWVYYDGRYQPVTEVFLPGDTDNARRTPRVPDHYIENSIHRLLRRMSMADYACATAGRKGSNPQRVYVIFRTEGVEQPSDMIHIASSLDKAKEWSTEKLNAFLNAGLQNVFDYPEEIVWSEREDGSLIAPIGHRGWLVLQEWEVDGDIYEVGARSRHDRRLG